MGKDTDLRYVKEALGLMPSHHWAHIRTPHLFGRNYFPSLLTPIRPRRPSLFIMKFTTVFAVLATLATAVSATLSDDLLNTNAKRLASGLTPLPPHRRGYGGSPTYGM